MDEGDGGYTLVEVLVTLVILGVAFVAILGGMSTSVTASDYHAQQADVEAALASVVETVKSPASTAHAACATPATYQSAAAAAAAGHPVSVSVASVQYWDGTAWTGACAGGALRGCGSAGLLPLQLVTVTASHADGRAIETLSFVKGCV